MTIAMQKLQEFDVESAEARKRLAGKFGEAVSQYDVMDKKGFAAFVRSAEDVGVRRSDIAEELKVSASTVSRWASGKAVPATFARGVIVERIGKLVLRNANYTLRQAAS